MRHITFCAAGFVFILLALILAPSPTGAAFDCWCVSVPCFVIALWAPKGGLK